MNPKIDLDAFVDKLFWEAMQIARDDLHRQFATYESYTVHADKVQGELTRKLRSALGIHDDDGEPITPEWLRSLEWTDWLCYGLASVRGHDTWRLIYDCERNRWELSVPGFCGMLNYDLPTRGDLRRLCAALGIPLKETR